MNPERWHRVKALLEQALELGSEDRDDFLEEQCADDSQLREEVEALIAADQKAGSFLEKGPGEKERSSMTQRLAEGHQISHYRILQLIGEGGMGEVYEAEQAKPVQRRVALKLVKLGMDTREVLARFDTERQALALMNHPNIARVIDAGATEQGRPYFVMEYGQGIPISEYCDRNCLSVSERLELFLQVCEGVNHAHQKGIIHRDIKPSNILVTILDGKPVPKIIDFGIAKATARRLTEGTFLTELGQFIGTPEYMSPEQAEMTGADIDTRTDVYSLGVLLYELLSGVLPFEWKGTQRATFDEVRRQIREEEPSKPSTRLKSLRDTATTVAENRRTDPLTLANRLKGDLDWITMMALEKDRTRRYAGVSDLAADITRHLAHEPVLAVPASRSYRMGKFVQRHKVGVGAAALVVLALLLGVAGASLGLVRAQRAEALARSEAERANQEAETARSVSDFLVELFEVSDPGEARGNTVTAREILDRGAERIGQELQSQPLVQARLLDTMGNVHQNLGLLEEAESLFTRALEARQSLLGDEHVDVATSFYNLGLLQRRMGNYEEAEKLCRRSLSIREKNLGADDPQVAFTLSRLATVVAQRGRLDEAERLFKQSLEIKERQLGEEDPGTQDTMADLAILYALQGELEKAEPLFRRTLAAAERTLGSDHPKVGIRRQNLGILYMDLGKYPEAEELLVRGLEILKNVHGEEHPDVANAMYALANLYEVQSKYVEAEPLYRRSLALRIASLGPNHYDVASSLLGLADICIDQGRYTEADDFYGRALSILENAVSSEHPQLLATRSDYADLLRRMGRDDEAARVESQTEGTPNR